MSLAFALGFNLQLASATNADRFDWFILNLVIGLAGVCAGVGVLRSELSGKTVRWLWTGLTLQAVGVITLWAGKLEGPLLNFISIGSLLVGTLISVVTFLLLGLKVAGIMRRREELRTLKAVLDAEAGKQRIAALAASREA